MPARIASIAVALALVMWASGDRRGAEPAPLHLSVTGAARPAPTAPVAILSARNLTPGSRRVGSAAVASGGRTIRALKLRPSMRDEPGPGGGGLSGVLLVEIAAKPFHV